VEENQTKETGASVIKSTWENKEQPCWTPTQSVFSFVASRASLFRPYYFVHKLLLCVCR